MKRPLFFAVVMFALGEVICIIPNKTMPTGILFCVPVFISVICLLLKKKPDYAFVLFMGAAGFFAMYFQVHKPIKECLGIGTSMQGAENTEAVWADVTVHGIIKAVEEKEEQSYTLTVEVYFTEIYEAYCGIKGTVWDTYRVMVFGWDENIRLGSRVSISGKLSVPDRAKNPGGFDFLSYYEAKNILFFLKADSLLVEETDKNNIHELLENVKDMGIRQLKMLCDSKTASIYEGILFGNKKAVENDIKETYRMSGIAHILAISGLHISIVSGFFYMIFKRLGLSQWLSFSASIAAAFFYGTMAGFGMATVRAIIMLIISMLGARLGRVYDMLTGLALAAFVMLIINPMSITDQSLVLSVGAIFGVCLGTYLNRQLLKKKKRKLYLKKHRLINFLISSLVVSFSVNVVTFPLISYMYFEIPLYSIVLNIFVVPAMSVVIGMGFLGIVLSFASVFLGKMFIMPGVLLLRFFEALANVFLKLPFSVINTGKPKLWYIILYYMLLIFILGITNENVFERMVTFINVHCRKSHKKVNRKKLRFWRRIIVLYMLVSFFGMTVCIRFFAKREMLVFLDVGQGDGIIVSTENHSVIVIDGGSSSEKPESLAKYTLMPALKSLGMANVDFWVVTHGDSDHVNGLIYILENYDISGINIGSIIMAGYGANSEYIERISALAEENNIDVIYVNVGDMIADNSAQLVCCYPDSKQSEGTTDHDTTDCDTINHDTINHVTTDLTSTNDSSLVLSYRSENISCLFLGDISSDGISYMMSECGGYMEKQYTVVKVAHHGSRNSIYEPLYDLCSGNIAVISCGKNNIYGHPHEEVLECLKECGSKVFRTDESGAVIVRVKNGRIFVDKYYFK